MYVQAMTGTGESRTPVLIFVIVFCTTLSTLSFVARLGSRSLSALKLGWDDFLMALAVVRIRPPLCRHFVAAEAEMTSMIVNRVSLAWLLAHLDR